MALSSFKKFLRKHFLSQIILPQIKSRNFKVVSVEITLAIWQRNYPWRDTWTMIFPWRYRRRRALVVGVMKRKPTRSFREEHDGWVFASGKRRVWVDRTRVSFTIKLLWSGRFIICCLAPTPPGSNNPRGRPSRWLITIFMARGLLDTSLTGVGDTDVVQLSSPIMKPTVRSQSVFSRYLHLSALPVARLLFVVRMKLQWNLATLHKCHSLL